MEIKEKEGDSNAKNRLGYKSLRPRKTDAIEIKTENEPKPSPTIKLWPCKRCDLTFTSRRKVQAHRRIHRTKKIEESPYTFDQVQDLYICNTCSAEFQAEIEVEEHVKQHDAVYNCVECNSSFKDPFKYSTHMFEHSDDKVYYCPVCTYKSPNRINLYSHIYGYHLHRDTYRCEKCGQRQHGAREYKEHMNSHLGLEPITCVVCSRSFKFSAYLQRHQLRMHYVRIEGQLQTNECHICHQVLKNAESLEKHITLVHEKEPKEKKLLLCVYCGKEYSRIDKLKDHYKRHTGEKPFHCSYCTKRFLLREQLVIHERTHTGEKPYCCEICGKCFILNATRKVHMRTHTGERPFVCPHCNAGCISKSALKTHIKSCIQLLSASDLDGRLKVEEQTIITRQRKRASDGENFKQQKVPTRLSKQKDRKKTMKNNYHKSFTCKKCLEEFESRKSYYEHKKCHTADESKMYKFNETTGNYNCNSCNGNFKTLKEVEEHIDRVHQEMYTCDLCKNVSYDAFQYAIHLNSHNSGNANIQCPLCSYNSPQRKCMQNHINSVHYRRFNYNCTTCNKGFNDPVLFKEHYNAHLGIKSFICVVCNKQFMFSRYLTVHQTRYHTVHINGSQYANKCSLCPKIFSKSETLIRHMESKHSNNKDQMKEHLCDICGNSFRTTNKLKIHYRIHTGDKPYSCSFCGKAFSKRDYLVLHERVHTGEKPYACEYCGKSFNQAASHRIHVRGHTGERPYKCHLCNGGYISRGSLNLHLKMCTGFKNE